MTTFFSCTFFCLPKRQDEDPMEPNAFDLTWRNYLPSTSQLCPCIPLFKQPIRLEDDDDPLFLGPEFHNNNHNRPYNHQNAVRGYLNDPRDWEFDSMLPEEDPYDTFVTRNPFGKTKRKKKKQRKPRPFVVEEPPEFSEEEDAEFLGDDQIQHLAYQHPHDQVRHMVTLSLKKASNAGEC